jgi:UPF0288 family protein (methanogenesis marker protein 3)
MSAIQLTLRVDGVEYGETVIFREGDDVSGLAAAVSGHVRTTLELALA